MHILRSIYGLFRFKTARSVARCHDATSLSAIKTFKNIFLIFISISSFSATAAVKQPLTLQQAISRTLTVHPDLKAFAFQLQADQGMVTQAAVSAPMTFNARIEDALGSGDFSGISGAKTTLSIAWLLDNKLVDARVNLANNEAKLVAFEQQTKALDIAAKTASIYITLLSQKEQFALAQLALKQANKAFSDVQKQVKSAKTLAVDEYRAKANVAQKALVLEDLTHEIEASRAKLAAQWQGTTDFVASDSLLNIPSIVDVETTYDKLKQHPELARFAAEQRITETAVSLAKAEEKPAWQFNAGIKHDNFNNDVGLTAGISIPLGGENRNRGKIIALQAQQNVKQAKVDAWQKHTSTQILLVSHQLKHNRHVIEGLSTEVVPALESANEGAEKAYALGRYRYSEWYDIQQELINAQFDLISAYANVHQLNIELQRLTGTTLN